jgi:hypothetical protein
MRSFLLGYYGCPDQELLGSLKTNRIKAAGFASSARPGGAAGLGFTGAAVCVTGESANDPTNLLFKLVASSLIFVFLRCPHSTHALGGLWGSGLL